MTKRIRDKSSGTGNRVADLDRQIYGTIIPSWKDCIDLLGSSLIQLHINDGKDTDSLGEGLFPTEGEIPLQQILLIYSYIYMDHNNVLCLFICNSFMAGKKLFFEFTEVSICCLINSSWN
jgi:hypothetical protein